MPGPTTVALPSLRYWRVMRGMSQEQLAASIGVRRATVARLEAGYPSLVRTAHALARALDVSVADLMRPAPS
jgi:DNA-binding XRE family transcriptional regulator